MIMRRLLTTLAFVAWAIPSQAQPPRVASVPSAPKLLGSAQQPAALQREVILSRDITSRDGCPARRADQQCRSFTIEWKGAEPAATKPTLYYEGSSVIGELRQGTRVPGVRLLICDATQISEVWREWHLGCANATELRPARSLAAYNEEYFAGIGTDGPLRGRPLYFVWYPNTSSLPAAFSTLFQLGGSGR